MAFLEFRLPEFMAPLKSNIGRQIDKRHFLTTNHPLASSIRHEQYGAEFA
jgi:hypothetical protein